MDGPVVATAESPAGQAAPVAWFVEAGRTARQARVAGVGLRRNWTRWRAPLGLQGATEVAVSRWWSASSTEVRGASTQLTVVPVLRWRPAPDAAWFLEAGLGLALHGPRDGARSTQARTRWNFEDVIALGWQPAPGWALSLRYAHVSNAGLRKPNPGEDRLLLRLTASF